MAPARIQQLSPSLVNRIAAGEVIERPAAVVKELVENALDADATQILIDVQDGGRELIRVIDNGNGIDPADLSLAFASHATSKLMNDDDLFAIRTMGFRGEALASIGSVSHARILSRVPGVDAGHEIFNKGGSISLPQAAASNTGTVVEVRNLFFNTPARRKFIKGAPTEYGHISEMILRLALPYPQVEFKLTHNGRSTLTLPIASPVDRLLAAWPDDFRDSRLSLDCRDAEIRLHGIVGLPELARQTAKYQFLYLNGRHIRDKFIQHALRESFRGLTEPGRYPAAILMLEIPAADVDVNVHPTKTEVRFRDGGRIHGLVLSGIREKLLGSDLTPAAIPMRAERPNFSSIDSRPDLRQQLASFFRQAPNSNESADGFINDGTASSSQPNSFAATAQGFGESRPGSATLPAGFASRMQGFSGSSSASASNDAGLDSTPLHTTTFNATAVSPPTIDATTSNGTASAALGGVTDDAFTSPSHPTSRPDSPDPLAAHQPSQPNDAPVFARRAALPAIQLHNSYLVAQSDEGMIIIDQHALHERIMYEELLARVTRGPLEAQRLLIPHVVPASARQIALLEPVRPLLERLGIEVTAFGPDSVAVQSFPSFLEKLDPAEFVTDLLERGEQELLDLHGEELLHEILDMMSCKAAVKAGDPLSQAEIEALLARRELVERSSNCPHGRPTTLRLSLKDLDKQFKRTGF